MSLSGKRVARIEIKSKGDVYHELWNSNPHHIANISPTLVQNCKTHDGQNGTVGCVLHWDYFLDGKEQVGKTLILEIDEEKKLTKWKIIEGDLLKLYKNFFIYLHVDTKGIKHVVTWTVEYEKLSADVPDPDSLMELYTNITKDAETHHLKD